MGQEDQWAIGTALWGSAMGQEDPLIPWGQDYGAGGLIGTALWGKRTNGAWGQRYGAAPWGTGTL